MATLTKSASCTAVTGTISYTYTYSLTTTETQVTLNITKRAWSKVTGAGLRSQIFINNRNNRITWQTIYPAHTANSGSDDVSLTVNIPRGPIAKTYPLWNELDEVTGTSTNPTYISKGSTTVDITVPALQSYAVKYNANGYGTAPAAQTKYYGQNLTLQPAITAEGVSFVKWNTNAAGTGTSYNAGATYTSNAALTLYAVWKKLISSVSVGKTTAIRVADSTSTIEADEGEYAYLTIPYTVSGQASADVSISVTVDSEDPTVTFSPSSATKQETGTPLTGTIIVRASNCAVDKKYVFTVTITATNTVSGTTQAAVVSTRSVVLASAYFVMDVKAGGHGIHFGGSAVDDDFWVSMPAHFSRLYTQHGDFSMRVGTDTPSSNTKLCGRQDVDSNGEVVFYSESYRTTDNKTYTSFVHRRYSTDGSTNYNNGFYLYIDNSGAPSVSFTNNAARDAWVTALNVLKKSGDTLNGGALSFKSTNVTSNTTVSSNAWGNSSLVFHDNGDTEIGRLGMYFTTAGLQYVALKTRRSINGSNVDNELSLRVSSNGTRTIGVTDAEIWRNALGASSGVWTAAMIPNLAASKITSGTLALARGGTASDNTARAINTVFAGPSSGDAGNASWRKLVADDIPNLNTSKLTGGTLGIARGGTGTTTGIKGWTKILDAVNNTTARTIDLTNYTDIAVCVYQSTSYRSGVIIPKAFLATSLCELYLGGWGTNVSGSNRRGYCKISTTQFQAGGVKIDSTDTTGTWYVYGR